MHGCIHVRVGVPFVRVLSCPPPQVSVCCIGAGVPARPSHACAPRRDIEGTAFRLAPALDKEIMHVDVGVPSFACLGRFRHYLRREDAGSSPCGCSYQYLRSRLNLLTVVYGGVASRLWTSPPPSMCHLVCRYMLDAVKFLERSNDDFRFASPHVGPACNPCMRVVSVTKASACEAVHVVSGAG